ncbi:hypothetical protein GCM10010271_67190 [Streptomyces kurssanovii]|nr:hypothetical protein GCM10010271_67190 [Streptomyces kurssanovii]
MTLPSGQNRSLRVTTPGFTDRYLRHYRSELWLATPGGTHAWDNPDRFREDTVWAVESPWAP